MPPTDSIHHEIRFDAREEFLYVVETRVAVSVVFESERMAN